jgi:hypothetical protein
MKADTFAKIDKWQWVSEVKVNPVEVIKIYVYDYWDTVTFSEEADILNRKLYIY